MSNEAPDVHELQQRAKAARAFAAASGLLVLLALAQQAASGPN